MTKLTGESMNITEENIKKLQQLFPECACDGKVDFDKLKQVLGEDNFIAQFPWQSRQSIQNDTDLSNGHEYIVAYAKIRRKENRRLKESNADKWFTDNSFLCLPLPLDKEKFSNPDNDPRGLWKADPFDAPIV